MSDLKVQDLMQTGKTLIQRGDWAKALKIFQALYSRRSELDDPETVAVVTSYYGLAKVKAARLWQEGLQLCEEARDLRAYMPECYLNLAQVYLERPTDTHKEKARQLLEAALKIDAKNRLAMRLLRDLEGGGPTIPFLSASNPINIILGGKKKK